MNGDNYLDGMELEALFEKDVSNWLDQTQWFLVEAAQISWQCCSYCRTRLAAAYGLGADRSFLFSVLSGSAKLSMLNSFIRLTEYFA